MNWNNIRRGLKQIVESIDGLSHAGAVEWADSGEASAYRDFPRINLSVKSLQGFGDDEPRTAYDPADDTMTTVMCGHRKFTLSLRIESEQATGADAMDVADRLRTRLVRDSVTDALRNEHLAIADFAPTQVLDWKTDGRALVVAVLDVFMNAAENDIDDGDRAGDFIQRVVADSDSVTNPDGTANPNQIHLDVSA